MIYNDFTKFFTFSRLNWFLAIFILLAFNESVAAANSSIYWQHYLDSRAKNTDLLASDSKLSDTQLLPNFSYAGYQFGETALPTLSLAIGYPNKTPKFDPELGYKIFSVTDFGAISNDGKSDKENIRQTILAAEHYVDSGTNGAIVFFPTGRFRVNEQSDIRAARNSDGSLEPAKASLYVSRSNIILRGSGSQTGGTELFMAQPLEPLSPKKMWTTPKLLYLGAVADKTSSMPPKNLLANIVSRSQAETTRTIVVNNPKNVNVGQWVMLRSLGTGKEALTQAMSSYKVAPTWRKIHRQYEQREQHLVTAIEGNRITFKAPLLSHIGSEGKWIVENYNYIEQVGIEDLALVGNWQLPFVHHRSALDDSGWGMISMQQTVNSWVKNIRLQDFNAGLTIKGCAAITVLNVKLAGTPGHLAGSIQGSSRVLAMNIVDSSNAWHAFGVSHFAAGNVILNSHYEANTSPNIHAAQPRKNLFDGAIGGWVDGRWGGSVINLPNHLNHLVFWNPTNTQPQTPQPYQFMHSDTPYGRIPMPYLIGLHGYAFNIAKRDDAASVNINKLLASNREQNASALQAHVESMGQPVLPTSLYAAQLEHRLGQLPQWFRVQLSVGQQNERHGKSL